MLITRQRAARRGHGHKPSGRTRWNGGCKERIRLDGEGCRRPIEGNAGGAGESSAENANRLPHLAQVAYETYERAKSGVEPEDRALSVCSIKRRRSVERPVSVLDQGRVGVSAACAIIPGTKSVERSQSSTWRDLEDGASAIGAAL